VFVVHKFLASKATNARLILNLGSYKNAELKYPLEFFINIIPSVIITDEMGWKVVIYYVLAARTIRENVISLPTSAFFDFSAANMAPLASFL